MASGSTDRSVAFLVVVLCGVTAVMGWADESAKDASAEDTPTSRPLPNGELGRVIETGREIVAHTNTHPLSKPFVGNALTCSSCHLDAGTDPKAATFIGVATAYPAWAPREKRVITLEDRVLNCFMRSMNGTRPPNGSEVSVAMTAYISWLSDGESMRMNAGKPLGPRHVPPLNVDSTTADVARGKTLYSSECAVCHGEQGQGGDDGPPVWGAMSYNDGAGLSRVDKLGSWLKVAMPLGDPSLSEQDALDIAAYVNSHDRPHFDLKSHLPEPNRLGEYNADRSVMGDGNAARTAPVGKAE